MMMIHKMKKQAGFTLIELLIVIVILGILAAVGIPKFMNNRVTAWAATCRANRASLADAAERLWNDTNAYPAQNATQSALLTGTAPGWDGPYIKAEFECPSNNSTGAYFFSDASGTVQCLQLNANVHPPR
jgi:prepilin-type N-terminal cleavage/methylation domain-containing protein